MVKRLNICFDSELLESISAEFSLRAPNKEALRQLIFTLDGDYDPAQIQVLNLATGVGKTYLMAAFVEYLRRQGVGNVVIVTPGKTVQSKTVQNFTPGSPRYIIGSPVPPEVVTPQDYSAWIARQNGPEQLAFGREVPVLAFIFNIQQLIAPKNAEGDTRGTTQDSIQRKPRKFDEHAGVLFDYLKELEDLVVIADESHLYSSKAIAFNSALKELAPAATVGLTASVDKKTDHVIFEYPLYRAIQDKYVKAPVLAFRKSGYGTDEDSEEQQLRDALQLRSLKQVHYDEHAAINGLPKVNAVMFVVCSDVDHATQVADLLRSPEYFGKEAAVLQVDSKHEDELSQRRLDDLDRPESPVLAVVSVNKLKEGWDVKNIAVVVTLRAMASEVLTQQTMGRGLRLPFGQYTGNGQIDQLDIIAHQSFSELLEAENVLKQFGLEDAIAEHNKSEVEKAIRKIVDEEGRKGEATPRTSGGEELPADSSETSEKFKSGEGPGLIDTPVNVPVSGDDDPGSPGLGFREIPDSESGEESQKEPEWNLVTIERNPAFADVSYQFPVATIKIDQPPVELSEIEDTRLEKAARQVTSAGDVLFRKEIVAALGKALRTEDRESAQVDSVSIDDEQAKFALIKLVLNLAQVPKTEESKRYIETFLVPKFMREVSFEGWTVKSLDSARRELQRLVTEHAVETLRSIRELPVIHPKPMPREGYSLPLGEEVHDQVEGKDDFKKYRVYGGWFKSLFAEESFDSFTGEYQLARLLNTSPSIVWWHRLHSQDNALVYYTPKDRYFPDFVALDTNGVHWIIEGKSEKGKHDAQVQAKRKAAEAIVRRLAAEKAYEGQKWGYLIAYEQNIKDADSWDDLKAFASPVSNAL
ncbi:DNA restriction-modification system, restriction enzyme [Corynebacterium phocae]|uniref:DNA restriction-modification system, restriction enzyme n=1 Tax=Corynebacterium phocae TaxID=161895 RepID=A0A1L7D4D8_9CORY|nr:DEAD/DEAH box helicase family protein [Corynebacterium phocae]APT92998.1 DNA restriction-modification system, restriction enzyme [Corynebacterium phocae]KAA8723337.1 restriction endonuclease [Corynebacterium phocae]